MVKAENIYTAEHFKAASRTTTNLRKTYITIAIVLVFTIIFGGLALSGTIRAIRAGRNADTVVMEAFAICLVWVGAKLVKSITYSDKVFEKAAASKQHIRHFEIDENELVQFTDSSIEHSERRFVMSGLAKAYDTGSFFVIYLYEDMYCIIGYNDITEGTPEELRTLLSNALGDRLIIKAVR